MNGKTRRRENKLIRPIIRVFSFSIKSLNSLETFSGKKSVICLMFFSSYIADGFKALLF
jgi:hypothetical protein